MESELPEENGSEVSKNQNSTLNDQILPSEEVCESDCHIGSPPSVEDIQSDSNSDGIIIKGTDSTDELVDLDSELVVLDDELDPPVPIIVEDYPADRKALKSCLRSRRKNSESENGENFNSSFPRCEGYDQDCDSKIERTTKKDRKVRFYLLKRKAKPTRSKNPGRTVCLTRRKFKRGLNPRPPRNGGVAQGRKVFDISTANSVEQNTNFLKVGYRRKHDTCVTQPDIGVSCNSLSCNQFGRTVDGKFEASGANVEKDKPNSRVCSKGLLRQRFKDSKNLHLKKTVISNSSDKTTIMEKLYKVNEANEANGANDAPRSTLSPTLRKEIELRRLYKKEKHNHPVNMPRKNVILRKSLLTNACANISTSCIKIPSDKQGLPDKDIFKTGVSSMYRNDPVETTSSKESMNSTQSSQNDPEIGDQVSDIGMTVPSQGKQKQADVLNSQKETVMESNTLVSVKIDAVSNVCTSQFIEISRDSMDSNVGNLQTCSENQLKSTPKFPASPKGKLGSSKSDGKNLEDNKSDQGGLAFLKDGKSLQTSTSLGLFNMNSSAIINNDETIYEDFGSLAQKLKRCRKSSVPIKLVKETPEAVNSKDVEDVSFSPSETGEDIISRLSDSSVKSIENAELRVCGSGSEHGISQSPVSASLVKKPKSKRERKNSKNDTSKQIESDKIPAATTTAVCMEQKSGTSTSASSNIVQKSSQHDSSNCDSDSRLKEEGLSTRTTSFSEEQSVKSPLSRVSFKYKPESVKHSITDLSEISKDIPKTVTAIDRKNICFNSKNSSQKMIEYLDLAGAERKKKERLVALTQEVVESFAENSCLKKVLKMPTKCVMNTSDTKKEKEGGTIERSVLAVNINSVSESKDKSETLLEPTCSPTESVGKEIAKLSLSTKVSAGIGSTPAITTEVSHSLVHSSTAGIKRKKTDAFRKSRVDKKMKTNSPGEQKVKDNGGRKMLARKVHSSRLSKIRSSSTPTKLRSEDLEKKKSLRTPVFHDSACSSITPALRLYPQESLNGSVVSDLESSPSGVNATILKTFETGSPKLQHKFKNLSPNTVRRKKFNRLPSVPSSVLSKTKLYGKKSRKSSDRELLQRYSIKNCRVKLEKLTSEDIKRHSCFAFKGCTEVSRRSTLQRRPHTPSRRKTSIIPENIPKLQKVMEDVISSDDESWIGWNSLISDFGQGVQLVSVMEGSKVTHQLIFPEDPDSPTSKSCDKSTGVMEGSKVTHQLIFPEDPDSPTSKSCDKSTDTSDLVVFSEDPNSPTSKSCNKSTDTSDLDQL